MDGVAVEQGVGAVGREGPPGDVLEGAEGLGQVLGQAGGDVDAEAGDAAVGPEAQGGQEVCAHLGLVPVEVGLLGGEHVEVPLVGAGSGGAGEGTAVRPDVLDALPRGAAEHGHPVVGGLGAALPGAGAHVVEGAFGGVGASGEGGAEPGVAVGGVVGDDVDDDADAVGGEGGDHAVEVLQGADLGGDVAVIVDVVAAVGQGGGVEGGQPDGVDAEGGEVGGAVGDTSEVPDAVAVGVGEGAGVDLVDDGVAPPVGVRGRCG
ncbi:hypothetical protein ADENT20671_2062 [Actinomyces denticolens]|nr:hypothetical protein ADENT20671_2062 [Actinomyces denticolens]